MTELVPVEKIPNEAIDNGNSIRWVGDERLVVTWTDDNGTVYSEEYERTGPPKVAVETTGEGMVQTPENAVALADGRTPEEAEEME